MCFRKILQVLLCFCIVFQAVEVWADVSLLTREQRFTKLFDYPCRKFGIPKALAMAIARQESDMRPLCINLAGKDVYPATVEDALEVAKNAQRRGISYDVGIMQVNSYWIRKYKIPLHLLLQPRSNIYMGCWILKQEIDRYGLNWLAVGRYHSPTDWRARDYSVKIKRHLRNILVAYSD
ncbi:MAG: lytic transglycosylase domain-containing protein [Desulfovibrio sp.]|nr:lytic transglycosylase domain-containing protein [Desulfovibrio sp.]